MPEIQFAESLEQSIKSAVDSAVQAHVAEVIEQLAVDPIWVEKIENIINQTYTQKLSRYLSSTDVATLIAEHIDAGIDRWQERLKKDFQTQGIADRASSLKLSVEDDVVVVNNQLVSNGLHVATDAVVDGSLTVDNLVVKKTINVDNRTWQQLTSHTADRVMEQVTEQWKKDLVTEVLDLAKSQGIDFERVNLAGRPLIDGNQLNLEITESGIEKLATLRDLRVRGPVDLNGTVTVKGRRVGINTEDPESALSIWDEEVAITAGKHSKDTAFIGTAKKQALNIGINRGRDLQIDADGLVTVKELRLDRWRISFSNAAPGYSGTRGDLVINHDLKPDMPFAWVCLGAFRWQPLKSA